MVRSSRDCTQGPAGDPLERGLGVSMSSRQDRANATRQDLIDAGLRLAERMGLTNMSVNLIVGEAGVAKGTFFHPFTDRAGFLLALHREFHDRLFAEINEAIRDLTPGRDRLVRAAYAYLDGCLRDRGVRALLLEARAEPLIGQAVLDRNEQVSHLIRPDFAAMGWPHPAESGRLWTGLVVEAALVELQTGGRQTAVREALTQFLMADAT
jgi:TetR/AcrR family transcriptional regulator, transcriptional repressor for nem operon